MRIYLYIDSLPTSSPSFGSALGSGYHPAVIHRAELRNLASLLGIVLFSMSLGVPASAEEARWLGLSGNPDPLRLAILPFGFETFGETTSDGWQGSVSLSYFNVWRSSPEVQSIHVELGRDGLPLESAELRELERRDPSASHLHVDLEGSLVELVAARRVAGDVRLVLRIPWLSVGEPGWDGIAEGWHSALGIGNFGRGRFPRGETFLFVRGGGCTLEAGASELSGSGPGDLSLALAKPVSRLAGGRQELSLLVEAPTGRSDGLHGNGKWDFALRGASAWEGERRRVLLAGGWTRTSARGGLSGLVRPEKLWHLGLDWQERLGESWIARGAVTWERAALDLPGEEIVRDPSLYLRFGLGRRLAGNAWAIFEVGQDQDSGDFGLAPDFSFHLTVGTRM
jgi:hypothetical protein